MVVFKGKKCQPDSSLGAWNSHISAFFLVLIITKGVWCAPCYSSDSLHMSHVWLSPLSHFTFQSGWNNLWHRHNSPSSIMSHDQRIMIFIKWWINSSVNVNSQNNYDLWWMIIITVRESDLYTRDTCFMHTIRYNCLKKWFLKLVQTTYILKFLVWQNKMSQKTFFWKRRINE